MDFAQNSVLGLIARRLGYLNQRQVVLAENVANADTPGYAPRDVVPFAEHLNRGSAGGGLHMVATSPVHMTGSGAHGGADTRPIDDIYETAPSGNQVNIEQQMMLIAETTAQHQLALNLHRKHVEMIRVALGRGGGR